MKKDFEEIQKEIEKKEKQKLKRKSKRGLISGKSVFKLQEILKKKPKR